MSSKKEFLTELVKDNDLNLEEDIFRMPLGGKQVAIITRTGIEKIQYNNNIQVFFDTEVVERDFVVVRAVASLDGMSARYSPIPHEVLAGISTEITNSLKGQVNRVVYDITHKPPGTIEWE